MLRNRSWAGFAFLVLTKRKAGSRDEIAHANWRKVGCARMHVLQIQLNMF